MFDVIVIGGGPAGISAAVYLKRFKLDVLVLMKDYGSLGKTDHIENYYGFPEPMTGTQVVDNGVRQARRLGIDVKREEVLNIDNADGFVVKTTQGEYLAKTVLLATGSSRPNLQIPGFQDFIGKGISYCAICDGFLYRKKAIGLLGEGEFMAEELEVLKNFSPNITVFTHGKPLIAHVEGANVVTSPVRRLEGDELLRRVLTDEGTFSVDVLFVAVGTPSATDFALRMGAFIENNVISVDDKFMTNIPGLFAAGDCIGGLSQIAKAVSDGAHAALHINKFLRSKPS
ncbi:MAG TPA: NAD(P)/FAD-dependent oxidoreductase [Candidatus Izemoplasmatales bacterium]|nr:NAD(P)/FAD-dependent oxidoreductase [Candidatus Izemoplasmatales bacterium]